MRKLVAVIAAILGCMILSAQEKKEEVKVPDPPALSVEDQNVALKSLNMIAKYDQAVREIEARKQQVIATLNDQISAVRAKQDEERGNYTKINSQMREKYKVPNSCSLGYGAEWVCEKAEKAVAHRN